MNPEVKHQLYGGDISDYFPQKNTEKKDNSPEKDLQTLGDIYSNMVNRRKGLPGIKPEIMKQVSISR